MRLMIRLAASCAVLTFCVAHSIRPVFASGDWNDAIIGWRPYAKALSEAKQRNKRICLVIYTNWCPHCRNYRRVFYDREVVGASRQFVMVRLDADIASRLSRKFAFDGTCIPRTYFLSPDGTPHLDIHCSSTMKMTPRRFWRQ